MIVHSWWFYLLQLCSEIKGILLLLGLVALVPCACNVSIEHDFGDSRKFKFYVKCCIACIAVILVSILIPSKETILLMMTAKIVTEENIQFCFETLMGVVDYASSLIQ